MGPLVSVIIPTLNSAKTLENTLASVRRQSIDQSLIEIIIADGGSSDSTCCIATRYGCRIVNNEHTLPEYGKSVGLAQAKGRFGVFLDSDEEILLEESFLQKIKLLESCPTVHSVITAGLITPFGYGVVSDYINRYGDPYSYFIYKTDAGDFLDAFLRRYSLVFSNKNSYVFSFPLTERMPICDGGGHFFRLEYLRTLKDVADPRVVPCVFQLMASKHRQIAVVKNDFVRHYSTSTFIGFLRKIHWRIIGNVHYAKSEMTGHVAREKFNDTLSNRFKKFFFVPYCFSLVLPLVDALSLSIRHRDLGYMLHFPVALFTCGDILFQVLLRFAKVRPQWGVYK